MFSKNNRISLRQMKRLLILDLFSVSCVLIVPVATRLGGTDGILLILVSSLLAFAYAMLMLFFYRQIGEDFFEFSKKTIGKIATFLLAVFYIFKLLYSLIFLSSYFSGIIQKTLLIDTNQKIILAALILIGAYQGYLGIEERGRIAELLFWFVLLPFSFFFFRGIFYVDLTNLSPWFLLKGSEWFSGSYGVFCIYAVVESLLFTLPYLRKSTEKQDKLLQHKRERRCISSSILISCVLQIFLFVITVGILGVKESASSLYPTIVTMGVVDFPGNVIQRQDAILIGFWIFSTFILLGTLLFYLSYTVKKAFHGNKHSHYIIPISIFAFLGAATFVTPEINFELFSRYMQLIGIPQSILFPILLILIHKLKREKPHE